ncbi:MAG: Phosphoserine phosphatase 1 [Alphaproteobacteria bacterium MarineAlpha2_Bin1]|nr:MAG: Phosphoserine phosphatase 1 [Alphaproteobacteria bacterium MarineAlpha2_Bin1]
MNNIIFIRHAETEWNLLGLIQGLTDVPICKEGEANACKWKLNLSNYTLWSSPLQRAVKTAEIVFSRKPKIEKSLIEMNWGDWEGKKLTDLRKKFGEKMLANENLGLDMRPKNGETPREVQNRILNWIKTIERYGNNHVCVTHKGVIRSVIALATDWKMIGKIPIKIEYGFAYSFNFSGVKELTYSSTIPLI